jgi:hypothetical protein
MISNGSSVADHTSTTFIDVCQQSAAMNLSLPQV